MDLTYFLKNSNFNEGVKTRLRTRWFLLAFYFKNIITHNKLNCNIFLIFLSILYIQNNKVTIRFEINKKFAKKLLTALSVIFHNIF